MALALAQKQQTWIEDLLILPDPQERLAELMRRGVRHQLEAEEKVEANRVQGCQSQVWLVAHWQDGSARFVCDAESPMVKGLAAALCDLYSDQSTAEIRAVEPVFWEAAGLHKVLSPTRLRGLSALRKRIVSLVTDEESAAAL
jgi:cysteine desulfuration protein SufE